MALLKKPQLILVKIQPVAGTDPVPAPDTDAILASEVEFSLVETQIQAPYAVQWMGSAPPVNIGQGLKIKFKTPVRGKGLGVAPEVDPLLRAANYLKNVNPGVNVGYTRSQLVGIEAGSEMCAIYYYQDKVWHSLLGCRGTVQTPMPSGQIVFDQWEVTGIYSGPVRVSAIPAATLDKTIPQRFISANCTIGGFSPKFKNLTLDLGAKVVMRESANEETGILEWMISDTAPQGSIDPEVAELVQAVLTTAIGVANAELVFTANKKNYPGVDGNVITVEYADGGVAGAETVAVNGTAITVTVEAATSTADQVKTALEASDDAMALLESVDYAANNDGSGAIDVMAASPLADGSGVEFWKRWEDSTGMDIIATVGQTAGKKCTFTAKGCVLKAPTYGDRDNILTHALSFTIHPTSNTDGLTRVYA